MDGPAWHSGPATDRKFRRAAEVLWPDDARLAWSWSPVKGRAEARRALIHRFEGWSMLASLRKLAEAVAHAERELRGAP